MPFWSETYNGTDRDPKRNFRFKVTITSPAFLPNNVIWWAKEVTKPSFTVNVAEHSYLNHKFKFPGTVTWNDIDLTVVDPQEPDAAALLSKLWENSGYAPPQAANVAAPPTVSKGQAVTSMGSVFIAQVDAAGVEIEKWSLTNAFCKGITYGDAIAYGNDELTTYKLSIAYDFASITGRNTSITYFD